MLGEIDKSLKPIKSRLFLCKPNRQTIAELSEAYNVNLSTSYNGIHELRFTLPYVIEKNQKFIKNKNVDLIRGDYLVRVEKGNSTSYFVVTNPTTNADNGIENREFLCFLQPYEIRDKLIRNYKETKKLYDPIGTDGVLNDTLLAKADWTVSYVDPAISETYRTFEVSEQTLLDFVTELTEKFDVVAIWNTINKTVSFYKEENIGQNKGLSLEYGIYLRSLNKEEDFTNVTTRLYVYGKDNISINKYNPTGTDYVESFAYYLFPFERDINRNVITESHYMSNSLCHAILDYVDLLDTKTGEFETLIDEKETLQADMTIKQNELFDLETELLTIQDSLEVAKATGEDTTLLEQDRDAKQAEIDAKNVEISDLQTQLDNVDADINTIKTQVAVENNFTNEQLIERNKFIKERTWTDQTYFNEKELYEDSIIRLEKYSQPIVSYKVSLVDFLSVVECQRDWDKLVIGDTVTIRYPKLNINIKARIIGIEHDEENNNIELEIANVRDIETGLLTLKDLFKKTVSSSTTLDMSKFQWDKSEENSSQINDLINNIWDATKREIQAGVNNSIEIGRKGIVAKDLNDPNQMVIIQGGRIALSGDGGDTWNTAIYPDKIAAELIAGKLGAFVEVRADQIILGDAGEQLPTSVVNDTDYVKTTENYNQTFISQDGVQVKDGTNSNVVTLGEFVTNKYGLRAEHSDGSYTQLTKDGLERFVGGESKPYQYETHLQEDTTISPTGYGTQKRTKHTDPVPTYYTDGKYIQLPDRFKGKNFKAFIVYRGGEMAHVGSTSSSSPIMKINSIDYTNAIVHVIGYNTSYWYREYDDSTFYSYLDENVSFIDSGAVRKTTGFDFTIIVTL